MALHKRYEISPDDPDQKVYLALQDFRSGREDGSYIELTLKDDDADPQVAEMGWNNLTVWLTRDEVSELYTVLGSFLDIVTPEVEALRSDA